MYDLFCLNAWQLPDSDVDALCSLPSTSLVLRLLCHVPQDRASVPARGRRASGSSFSAVGSCDGTSGIATNGPSLHATTHHSSRNGLADRMPCLAMVLYSTFPASESLLRHHRYVSPPRAPSANRSVNERVHHALYQRSCWAIAMLFQLSG